MQEEVAWQQKEVTVHGKTVMQPRLVAYMGDDPSLAYTYSRQTMIPDAWTPAVKSIKVIWLSSPYMNDSQRALLLKALDNVRRASAAL